MFKGANKSTIWYNVADFKEAGVEPAKTWPDLTKDSNTLKAAGNHAVLGGRRRRLADQRHLRERLSADRGPGHVRQARDAPDPVDGPVRQEGADDDEGHRRQVGRSGRRHRRCAADGHADVRRERVLGQPEGRDGRIGDFAPGVTKTTLKPVSGFNVFDFPSIDGSKPSVVGGGDLFVEFKKSEAADKFLEYLTTTEAAEIWAKRGGFSSPNKHLDENVYPDEITKTTATALANADTFRFDLSDLQPAAFGATPGQGLFKEFSDFVANPNNVDQVTQKMEADAKKAYAK